MAHALQPSTDLPPALHGAADSSIAAPGAGVGSEAAEKVASRAESAEPRLIGPQATAVGAAEMKEVSGGTGGFEEPKVLEAVKRRRGRPPRAQGKLPPPPTVKDNDEEDVCFICFDGGSLVLCDRRGCPKAYHPACIKRDEAFFQSAAKWNCGWHICSTCQKSSHFMCYTCTYSLCKGCAKGADFLCVRGNKGFCTICWNMVKLIENSEQGNKEMVQVDFDDKTSWEYLFKVYWIYLKTKLSLTFDELIKAKKVDMSVSLSCKRENSDDRYASNHSCLESDYVGRGQAVANSKRRKTRRWPITLHKEAPQSEEKLGGQFSSSFPIPTEWASKELLEFVSHMKKGDTSSLTPFDAQSLLLQYIKNNDLRDPNCQSQIICDSRLRNMFGKARLGHIEMLKLVEYHFPLREDARAEKAAPIGIYDMNTIKADAGIDETNDNQLLGKEMRHRRHKKDGNKGPEISCDGYAAIDVHNINLIYLPLHLMENLLADDKFHEKAVGSVVRIKMSSSDRKQDMYRLVQVVGAIKMAEPYKVRNSLTDWKLEILNISKKEIISIDEISDQEFSEDECKRFRQSIKYGLATRFTVGEILERAMALRAVKLIDYIKSETLRLNHLRDRASENGQNKEFKAYVDKIEFLNSPGERQRLLNEVPVVHEDPNMDPRHQSEEDSRLSFHKKHGDTGVTNLPGMKRKGYNLTSLSELNFGAKKNDHRANGASDLSTSSKANAGTITTMSPEKKRSSNINRITDKPTEYQQHVRKQKGHSDCLIQLKTSSPVNHFLIKNEMRHVAVTGTSVGSLPAEALPSAGNVETEKIWHYQDPSWNVQGPFSMLQLRKWNTSGYFPLDLRIWRTGEKQDESILLTDALDGQFCKKPGLAYNACEISIQSNASSEFVRSSCSSSLSTPEIVNSREGQCAESLKSHESLSNFSQLSSSPSTQTLAGKACEALSLLARERWNGPGCADKCNIEQEACPNESSPVPNLNNEDLESRTAENKEGSHMQNHVKNIKGRSADEKHSGPSNIRAIDSCPSSITESVPQLSNQPNSTLNLCSISLENQPTSTKQSAPYVSLVELEPLQVNPQLVGQYGQIQAVSSDVAKHMSNGSESQCTDKQLAVGIDLLLPDSGSSWTGGSCLVNASKESSMMPAGQDTWNSNSQVGSLPKPNELVVDLMADQPSTDGQYGVSPPFQFWHSIFGEDDEFPFADESVSDLLAEVDAMECLNGPASPTSAMAHAVEFSQTSKEDCFASDEDLNLTLNLRNGDALSSSAGIQMARQPSVHDQSNRRLEAGDDPQSCNINHSSSTKVK
uniref:Zinc finger CCCH domain-containing protein 44 n=1 Tax=Kalanchoe fedtschenkoi TaxID=63787 RepID=A0A7N0V459_KALFE